MRLDMNLPVLVCALLGAALLQDRIPATPALPSKVVFLTAAALYFALTKPAPVALTALVWAGALTDALGGLPLFCTFGFLLAVYGATRLMQRVFLEATLFQGALLVAGVAALQALWTRAWAGTGMPFLSWHTLTAAAYAVPAGAVAGLVGFAACGLIDRISGNVKPVKEGHGILWAETNR